MTTTIMFTVGLAIAVFFFFLMLRQSLSNESILGLHIRSGTVRSAWVPSFGSVAIIGLLVGAVIWTLV